MQTTSTSYWNGLGTSLTQLGLDYARARLVDVETRDDDRNINDEADLRYGSFLGDERGIKVSSVLMVIGVVGLVGGAVYVFLRR